ncbi:MAG: hypothetical protein WC683_20085 [bacterium]
MIPKGTFVYNRIDPDWVEAILRLLMSDRRAQLRKVIEYMDKERFHHEPSDIVYIPLAAWQQLRKEAGL